MFGRIHLWERLAWLGVTACLLLFTLVTAGVSGSRVARAAEQREAALAEAEQVRIELRHALTAARANAVPVPQAPTPEDPGRQDDATEVNAELRERLITDLQKHNELIPHAGILGGTMGFYDPQGIRILGRHWLLADFEDGHIDGQALLAYRITADRRIEWRLLDSYLRE